MMIVVSYATPAPARAKLAGLTFATVDEKLATIHPSERPALARETKREHQLNVAFSALLLMTVIGLWVYFR